MGHQLYLSTFHLNDLLEGFDNQPSNSTVTSNNKGNNDNKETSNGNDKKEYQPYNLSDPNSSFILAQQNAGNIEVLKGRIDDLDGVKKRVDTIQTSLDMMQTQIDGLVQQQAEYAQEIAGSTPPVITGTGPETVADVS